MTKPSKSLRHHAQEQMVARMQFLVEQIELQGKDGVDQTELEQIMFLNGLASPRLTRTYLSALSSWGRIRKEGRRYYGAGVQREERKIPDQRDLVVTHTHAHESLN
jgi:hypothetical protein